MSRRIVAWGFVLLVVAGLGWGGWWAAQQIGTSREQETPFEPVQVLAPVERRTLEERITTRGVAGFAETGSVVVGAEGRVTAVSIAQGDVLQSSEVIMHLDGRPVVTLAGIAPFWRDLHSGSRGSDVEALQVLLRAEGFFDGEVDGRFGPATKDAVEEWQRNYGTGDPDGVLMVGDTVIGDWPARVGAVRVAVGDFVVAGDEIATLTSGDPAVSVALLPSERLRTAVGADVRMEIGATGETFGGVVSEVTVNPVDRNGSLVYPATVELSEPLGIPDGTLVRVSIVVERSEDVVTVPVAAVVGDADGQPVVRVVDEGGATRTASVELGMSEGAWVEVTAGLSGGETVLVAAAASGQ